MSRVVLRMIGMFTGVKHIRGVIICARPIRVVNRILEDFSKGLLTFAWALSRGTLLQKDAIVSYIIPRHSARQAQ